jgi:hypothetical protein
MINQLRTLLLNSTGTASAGLAEVVPADFAPIQLVSAEASVQRCLVPPHFQARTRNHLSTIIDRLAETHALYSKVLEIDPRRVIINSIDEAPLFPTREFPGAPSSVKVFGEFSPKKDLGIFSAAWRFISSGGGSIFLVNQDTSERIEYPIVISSGSDVSGVHPIEDSGLSFRIVGSETVPAFDATLSVTHPILFEIGDALQFMRSDDNISGVFNLADRVVGQKLLDDFLNSDHPSVAVAATAIAYTLHITERIYQ